jgi:hypothetical protein
MTMTWPNLAIAILIVPGVIALGIALLRGLYAIFKYQTGWKALTQRFPVTDVHKFGGRYKRQTGYFDRGPRNAVNGQFLIELAQEGLVVTPNFARRSPILIPWSAIRDVTETNLFGMRSVVLMTVDYEKELKFTIPKDALTAIQENVPAERLHQGMSFSELIKKRFYNPQETPGIPKPTLDDQALLVDSWWGAFAALMLLQAYNFILLPGLVHLFSGQNLAIAPVIAPWFFVITLSQAGGLRVMQQYLKSHDWKTALRFIHSPVETLKFCAAILSTGAYLYLLTGHKRIPGNPVLVENVGIIGNMLFQLYSLAMSFLINWLWKVAPNEPAPKPPNRYWNVIGWIIAMSLGVLAVVISCHDKEAFYIFGVLGYGIITICMGPLLTSNPNSWGVTN